MFKIDVLESHFFNDETSEFVNIKPCTLLLEHSLISISKWESKWRKPFLTNKKKTREETVDYIRCMTINGEQDPIVYAYGLTPKQIEKIQEYIDTPQTATTIRRDDSQSQPSSFITNEVIYAMMAEFRIPVEFQYWHFSRLSALIEVCVERHKEPKKMSPAELAAHHRSVNAARRKKH